MTLSQPFRSQPPGADPREPSEARGLLLFRGKWQRRRRRTPADEGRAQGTNSQQDPEEECQGGWGKGQGKGRKNEIERPVGVALTAEKFSRNVLALVVCLDRVKRIDPSCCDHIYVWCLGSFITRNT